MNVCNKTNVPNVTKTHCVGYPYSSTHIDLGLYVDTSYKFKLMRFKSIEDKY